MLHISKKVYMTIFGEGRVHINSETLIKGHMVPNFGTVNY